MDSEPFYQVLKQGLAEGRIRAEDRETVRLWVALHEACKEAQNRQEEILRQVEESVKGPATRLFLGNLGEMILGPIPRRVLPRNARDFESLTTGEVGRMLGVCRRTVARWVDEGTIDAAWTWRGHRRIPWSEVERLMALSGEKIRKGGDRRRLDTSRLRRRRTSRRGGAKR